MALHDALVAEHEQEEADQLAAAAAATASAEHAPTDASQEPPPSTAAPAMSVGEAEAHLNIAALLDIRGMIKKILQNTEIDYTYRTSVLSPLNGADANAAVASLKIQLDNNVIEVVSKASDGAGSSQTAAVYSKEIDQALPDVVAEYEPKGWKFELSSGELTIPVSIKVGDFTIEAGSINLYEITDKLASQVYAPNAFSINPLSQPLTSINQNSSTSPSTPADASTAQPGIAGAAEQQKIKLEIAQTDAIWASVQKNEQIWLAQEQHSLSKEQVTLPSHRPPLITSQSQQ